MKEATGELNMAVVVLIIVGLLSSFFFGFLWPMIKGNFNQNTKCNQAVCKNTPRPDGKTVECSYEGTDIICPWKG